MNLPNPNIEELRQAASALPLSPGVYIMKDESGKIIYVGKSRKLKNRVSSYFLGEKSGKTAKMVSRVRSFEHIVCKTEMEALTLENILIKRHSPKYNIKLKDCKSYPYIKVTQGEYPRILVTRDRRDDGAKYYGPYRSIADAYAARDVVIKIFGIPSCKRQFPRDIGRERPCIYAQMGRCRGICTGKVPSEEYRSIVASAGAVIGGNVSAVCASLTEDMMRHAEAERFEEAARCRDSIAALRKLCEKQTVAERGDIDADIFAIHSTDLCETLSVLSVRSGMLINKNEFLFSASEILDAPSALGFIASYYADSEAIPREILLAFDADEDDMSGAAEYLTERAGRRVTVRVPRRGTGHNLALLAKRNAEERAERFEADSKKEDRAAVRLASLLALEVVPERIEAYDISNIGSEHKSASMVVWRDGKLRRSHYRSFNIKTVEGVNDYASMHEALTRRLSHIGDGTESLGEIPDLILLDGGDEHVAVGLRALAECGLDIPLFGMVKDDYHKTRALTDGVREIHIAKEQQVYAFIYRIQEEAHRFAVSHTMGAKRRDMRRSTLTEIEGIGEAKAKLLLSHFGSIKKIREASVDDIAAVRGLGRKDGERIVRYFGGNKHDEDHNG